MKNALLLIASVLMAGSAIAAKSEAPKKIYTAHNSPHDVRCQATYERIYSKSKTDIRMVFGYKDTRPGRFVGDRHERLAFVQRILSPCPDNLNSPQAMACGFERIAGNSDLFTKTIRGLNRKTQTIRLQVVNSAVGSDDEANRRDPFQAWQSEHARKAFHEGLEKADIVFYNGHSRVGGGPDFASPKTTDAGRVDSKTYRKEREGFEALMESIDKRSKRGNTNDRLRVLGLFSCASSQLFADEITRKAEAAYISSEALLYYADALENSLSALSGLLEMRCEDDFKRGIHHDVPAHGSQVKNFY